jgi:hypothetical protein
MAASDINLSRHPLAAAARIPHYAISFSQHLNCTLRGLGRTRARPPEMSGGNGVNAVKHVSPKLSPLPPNPFCQTIRFFFSGDYYLIL